MVKEINLNTACGDVNIPLDKVSHVEVWRNKRYIAFEDGSNIEVSDQIIVILHELKEAGFFKA